MAACARRTGEIMGLLRILRYLPQNERMLLCFIFPLPSPYYMAITEKTTNERLIKTIIYLSE